LDPSDGPASGCEWAWHVVVEKTTDDLLGFGHPSRRDGGTFRRLFEACAELASRPLEHLAEAKRLPPTFGAALPAFPKALLDR
jgi:hypothetical protein